MVLIILLKQKNRIWTKI